MVFWATSRMFFGGARDTGNGVSTTSRIGFFSFGLFSGKWMHSSSASGKIFPTLQGDDGEKVVEDGHDGLFETFVA